MTTATTSPLAQRILAFAGPAQPFAKRDLYKAMPDVMDYKLDAEVKALIQAGALVGKGHTTLRVFHLPGYEPPMGSTHAKQHEENAIERVVARAKANGDAPALNGHGKAETTVKLAPERSEPKVERPTMMPLPARRVPEPRVPEPRVELPRELTVDRAVTDRDLRMEYFDLLMRLAETVQGDAREEVLDRLEKLIAA